SIKSKVFSRAALSSQGKGFPTGIGLFNIVFKPRFTKIVSKNLRSRHFLLVRRYFLPGIMPYHFLQNFSATAPSICQNRGRKADVWNDFFLGYPPAFKS